MLNYFHIHLCRNVSGRSKLARCCRHLDIRSIREPTKVKYTTWCIQNQWPCWNSSPANEISEASVNFQDWWLIERNYPCLDWIQWHRITCVLKWYHVCHMSETLEWSNGESPRCKCNYMNTYMCNLDIFFIAVWKITW